MHREAQFLLRACCGAIRVFSLKAADRRASRAQPLLTTVSRLRTNMSASAADRESRAVVSTGPLQTWNAHVTTAADKDVELRGRGYITRHGRCLNPCFEDQVKSELIAVRRCRMFEILFFQGRVAERKSRF